MTNSFSAALIAGVIATSTLLAATPARADTVYVVHRVIIKGSQSVPTANLQAVVKEQPGSKVTVNDILADRDAISKVLSDAHVVGSVAVSLVPKADGSRDVVFAIDDQGVHVTVTTVAPKLDVQTIDGNKSIPSATLLAATGLNPGDDLTDAKILAAEQGILQVYKAAKLPLNTTINGSTTALPNGTVDVVWHIVETKAPKK